MTEDAEMRTWAETLAEKIPEGPLCNGCSEWIGKNCRLFGEPCNGKKNQYCKANKWIEQCRGSE